MNNKELKVGDVVVFGKCACGQGALTVGSEYEVLAVQFPLFIFNDDNGEKRVRNIQSRCFKKVTKK